MSQEAGATRRNFDFDLGPVKTSGWVDSATLDVAANCSVMGIAVGDQLSGNLKDGVVWKVGMGVMEGDVKLYSKGDTPKELWMHVDLDQKFAGKLQQDAKIMSL